jgi:transcriptional regulator with XRE-family HTH domain
MATECVILKLNPLVYRKGAVPLGSKWHRLTQLREAAGLTQQELAQRLSISRSRISNYEQGIREPDHETTKRFAEFFDVTVDYLLDHTSTGSNSDVGGLEEEWLNVVTQMKREGYEPDQVLQALKLLNSIRKQQEEK